MRRRAELPARGRGFAPPAFVPTLLPACTAQSTCDYVISLTPSSVTYTVSRCRGPWFPHRGCIKGCGYIAATRPRIIRSLSATRHCRLRRACAPCTRASPLNLRSNSLTHVVFDFVSTSLLSHSYGCCGKPHARACHALLHMAGRSLHAGRYLTVTFRCELLVNVTVLCGVQFGGVSFAIIE